MGTDSSLYKVELLPDGRDLEQLADSGFES